MENFLKERGLELSKEKTLITNIEKGFNFLGMNIRKYNGKLLIKPSKTKVQLFLKKIKTMLRENLNTTPSKLIMFLNPILRGWGNYYQHVVSKQVFSYVDARVWQMIWKWTGHRHPTKSKTWRKRKYFKIVGSRNWVFMATMQEKGKVRTLRLFNLQDIPIRRHLKVKGEANPYDSDWETYFEVRLGLQVKENQIGNKKLLR